MNRPRGLGTALGRAALSAATFTLATIGPAWCRAEDSPQGANHPDPPTASRPARINIVIFLIDTLRADRLGVYGYERRPTSPRMDALAAECVVFEQAYAPAPWTLPSIVSLMTSTFPCEHNVVHNRHRLGDSLEPLAARLKTLGYTTFNLYANPFAGPRYGLGRGFDVVRSRARVQTDGKTLAPLLDEHPSLPFFVYIHNTEPHNAYDYAPEHTEGFRDIPEDVRRWFGRRCAEYRALARADFTHERPLGTTDNTAEQHRILAELTEKLDDYRELYDAAVRAADERVGSVVELLKSRGVWDSTLFMILADHGEEMSEHGGWLHDQSAYEELLRVPLIVHFPNGQCAGKRIGAIVSLVDVLPTVFACLQVPEQARGARGRSLLPLARAADLPAIGDFVVPAVRMNRKKYYRPWKETRGDDNVVVRYGEWKGIWNVEPTTLELYNLVDDSGEQHDVSADNRELALAMRAFAHLWYRGCARQAGKTAPAQADLDEETLEDLRSLGYID